MENEHPDYVYTKQDIYRAFDMGLEWAIHVFEKVIGFTPEGQMQLIEGLKKEISEDKLLATSQKKTLQLIKS